MKAGTATKMIINMISTTAMIKLNKAKGLGLEKRGNSKSQPPLQK